MFLITDGLESDYWEYYHEITQKNNQSAYSVLQELSMLLYSKELLCLL